MPIQHITELFALDGRLFVIEVYRNLLGREPDQQGMAYYLGRMAQGYGKTSVIAQVAQSQECRPHEQINGLKQLITEERFARHWFWSIFGRQNRFETMLRILRSHTFAIERIVQLLEFPQGSEPMHDQSISVSGNKIDDDMIENLYICLLGRKPESEHVFSHYKKKDNLMAVIKEIISSEEFFVKFSRSDCSNYSVETGLTEKNREDDPYLKKMNSNIAGINSLQRSPLEAYLNTCGDR